MTTRLTTLKIDDDVLAGARALALRQGKPVGTVISALARQGMVDRGLLPDYAENLVSMPAIAEVSR